MNTSAIWLLEVKSAHAIGNQFATFEATSISVTINSILYVDIEIHKQVDVTMQGH